MFCIVFGKTESPRTCYRRSETRVKASLQQKTHNKRPIQRYYAESCSKGK